MKNKILIFVIGFLVVAILATGGFIIYEKTKKLDTNNSSNQFPGGNPPQMMQDGNMQTPPEKPSGDMPNEVTEENDQKQNESTNTKKEIKKQKNETTNEIVENNI